jgi:MerR family mercuric resistance operon transcriptional regulator
MAPQDAISIGALARQSGVNIETIRYYERIGVLPEPARSAGGYRQYLARHAERLRFIRRSRDLGLSLDDVRRLLSLADKKSNSCSKVRELASHHLVDIRARIADLQRMERVLSQLVSACSKGKVANCPLLEALAGPGNDPAAAA